MKITLQICNYFLLTLWSSFLLTPLFLICAFFQWACTGVWSGILTSLLWPRWVQPYAVCFLCTAAGFVCGPLSEQPACCDERHLDLPIHFTFAPINYSTGQPIKNEGERSGPRPLKAATRQLFPWIIGAINLASSNKGVLTLPLSLSFSPYTAEHFNTTVFTDMHHNNTLQQLWVEQFIPFTWFYTFPPLVVPYLQVWLICWCPYEMEPTENTHTHTQTYRHINKTRRRRVMVPAKFTILFIKSQLKCEDGPSMDFHIFFSLPPHNSLSLLISITPWISYTSFYSHLFKQTPNHPLLIARLTVE